MHWNLELKTSNFFFMLFYLYHHEIKKLQKKSRMHLYYKTTKLHIVVHVPYYIVGHDFTLMIYCK